MYDFQCTNGKVVSRLLTTCMVIVMTKAPNLACLVSSCCKAIKLWSLSPLVIGASRSHWPRGQSAAWMAMHDLCIGC